MLVVEEVKALDLIQEFTWPLRKRLHLGAIRPYLYVHNLPAGIFTLEVLDADDNVLCTESFTAQDCYDALEIDPVAFPYAHVFLPLLLANPVALPQGVYRLRLSSTGYTFSESAYLAWVKEHENLKVPITYVPTDDSENPLTYELWGYEL